MKAVGRLLPIFLTWLLSGINLGAIPPDVPRPAGERYEQLPAADPMPLTLFTERSQQFPVWVDESEVLLPSGQVNPALFHPLVQEQIEAYLRLAPKEGKIRLSQIDEEIVNAPARPDLKSAVDTSALVLLGKVTGSSQGFHGETAGTLLRIAPLRTFKGAASQEEYFVFLPVGELKLKNLTLSKTDPRYAALPVPGDEVVLLVAPDWRNTGSFLWLSDEASLWAIKKTSGLTLPPRYLEKSANLIGARRAQVEQLIRDLVQRGRKQ